MKRLIAFLLVLFLAGGTVIGCEKDEAKDESSKTEAVLTDYDRVDSLQGFIVKGQKHPFNNRDILILDVENTTDSNYTVKISITFYDEAGEPIKTQKKTVEQFPAEYKQAGLFRPQCIFDSYICELSLEEYTGEVYISTFCPERTIDIEKKEMPLPPYTDMTRYPTLIAKFPIRFGPCTSLPDQYGLSVSGDVVLFDNTGKVYGIFSEWSEIYPNIDSNSSGTIDFEIFHSKDPDWKFPEELTGELTAIMIPEFSLIQLP